MNYTNTFYVLQKSKDDHHVKAIVDKDSYPEAIKVNILNSDVYNFSINQGSFIVDDDGTYRFDYKEDDYKKELESEIKKITLNNVELVKSNAQLQEMVNDLIKANTTSKQSNSQLHEIVSKLMVTTSKLISVSGDKDTETNVSQEK